MRKVKAKAALLLLGGIIVVGVLILPWAMGPGSSEAQQDAMHNCPQAGKWAISVWDGDDGTETGEALATCGALPVVAAYYLDPETGGWSYWFAAHPEPGVSNLLTLNNMQGVLALGAVGATPSTPTATPTPTPTPGPGAGKVQDCPQAGKWAISVWSGPDGTETGEALATCGAVPVVAAYSLDSQTGGWLGWFAGQPGESTLATVNNMQGVLALGAIGAPPPSPTPTPTPGTAGDVVLVSSNAFTTTSSILIDGESRRMHIVGELRNDSATPRSAGEVRIKIYDAADNVIGSRWTYAFDAIIMPGRTTAFEVTYPSLIYSSDETNGFPEGWTRYEISLSPRDLHPSEERRINVTVHDVQASVGDYGSLYVKGTVRNDDSRPQKWDGDVYAILYDQQDKILNASRSFWSEELQPGQGTDFEITFSDDEPIDYSRYLVQAYAEGE